MAKEISIHKNIEHLNEQYKEWMTLKSIIKTIDKFNKKNGIENNAQENVTKNKMQTRVDSLEVHLTNVLVNALKKV